MAGVPLRLAIGSTPRCVGIDEAWQGMQNAKESPQNTREFRVELSVEHSAQDSAQQHIKCFEK
jgi:hypothetical protein